MSTLLLVEHANGEPDELSLQALAFARGLGEPVEAVLVGGADAAARLPVEVAHVAEVDGSYAPGAWAASLVDVAVRLQPGAIVAAGTDRGNEVLANVACRLDVPFAADCISAAPGDPLQVTRQRWGGSLLEESRVHGSPALLSVAPHVLPAEPAMGGARIEMFSPAVSDSDLIVRVVESVAAASGGVSLAEAKVVVSGGRGVGSAEGFAIIEELAGLLGGAVGCSRVVTSAGWRPHTDQVGQTGTKVSPDLYIACGISGATQHIAGCKGAKKILAINADPEASIFASADYAVIGDLHEIVPAISAELRRVRGA
jgi:electron transfer flavoprotein alpha subunit